MHAAPLTAESSARLVMQRNTVNYPATFTKDFEAHSHVLAGGNG